MTPHISQFLVAATCALVLPASGFASEVPSYSCFIYDTEGRRIDLLPGLGQICDHSGPPVDECSTPHYQITQTEAGSDTAIPMGYVGFFATMQEKDVYLRIYSKPFIDGPGSRQLYYKALSVGLWPYRQPDLMAQLVPGELVCVKKF